MSCGRMDRRDLLFVLILSSSKQLYCAALKVWSYDQDGECLLRGSRWFLSII